MHQRTVSSSSDASFASSSSVSDDQFAFSACNTPANEQPLSAQTAASFSRAAVTSAPRDNLLFGKLKELSTKTQPFAGISELPHSPRLNRSQPIAIEIPANRKINLDSDSAAADTPPEPLSARGDIPGGYFPQHEDPKSRVRRPHPFHLDASKAKHRSLHQAAESSNPSSHVGTIPEYSFVSAGSAVNSAMSGSHTPVSSYIPTGVHDNAALPLGKYYPSNYERRPSNNNTQYLQPPATTSGARSESQVSKVRREPCHTRSTSEVKRRLLQYQRDMVAQATVAASALLANNTSLLNDPETGSKIIGGMSLPTIQLGGKLIKNHKPRSPKLAPMGSPGPVTPMSLEGGGDSYLTLGRPMTGPDAEHQVAEVARVVRAENGRQRHGDACSPISI
ncbi:hypothetical protein B0T25DRAFT_442110 [Lasiosphaeria hispida]|uniref:Uncharacterized protein n=1 Tax=Lasiosphaeria hispida TaxID=260671 RepID=A0AAJ0HX16_9PEZI|nr:hypothetical protein B0T25DRAFT_442110 [Lasiosphaeria hispida]